MDINGLSDLLNKCRNDRDNLLLNNEYLEKFHAYIKSAKRIGHSDINLIIKATEIDDGLSAMYLFESIRSMDYLKKFWNAVRENKSFGDNFNGRSYKFLCAAMNFNYKNQKMNDYQWSQIMEHIVLKKGDKSFFDYELIFKEYFLDEVISDIYLPDIKRIATNNQVYEQFVRFMRNVLQSKPIRESKTNVENINYLKSWINPYIEDIKSRGKTEATKRKTVTKDSKKIKDTIKQNNEEILKQKSERVIVMINPEKNYVVEPEQVNSDSLSSEMKQEENEKGQATIENNNLKDNFEANDEKIKKDVSGDTVSNNVDIGINDNQSKTEVESSDMTAQEADKSIETEKCEIENISDVVSQDDENTQEDVKTVDVLKNAVQKSESSQPKVEQNTIADIKKTENSIVSEGVANSEEGKKSSEKKTKKTKKKSEELKGLAEYFEKLEIVAEENAKELQEKEKRIEELNKIIASRDGEVDELRSEMMKLKSELRDKSRSSDELTKKLEESMEMNLSFETIKATREESLKKDIADSLRNIYEDYNNSIDETMDNELGEIYREKIGEIFQILEKDGVKVEL